MADLKELAKQKGIEIKPDLADIQPAQSSVTVPGRRRAWLDFDKNLAEEKSRTNPEQTQNKLRTERPKTQNTKQNNTRTNPEQTQNKLRTERPKTQNTKQNKSRTNSEQNFIENGEGFVYCELSGLQKRIIEVVYEFCKSAGDKITDRLSLEALASACKANPAVVQVTTRRLIAKGALQRFKAKAGRGGWTRYSLSSPIYAELYQLEIQNKLRTSPDPIDSKSRTQTRTQTRTSPPSSSRDLINKETTTSDGPCSEIHELVDVRMAESLGISNQVIARSIELYPSLQADELQDLVFRFSQFMKDPKNKVQNPRGFFFGLCKQLSQGITPLDHILTPEQELLEKVLKESKAAALRKQETEEALLNFEFGSWLESIPDEKRNELVPESAVVRAGSHAQTVMLKKHYVENFWDDRRLELLAKAKNLSLTL